MAFDFTQAALDYIGVYGLLAVFILLVLDGAMLLPAVPGEVILVIAMGIWAPDLPGFFLVLSIAVAAAMVGGVLLYAIGRGAAPKPGKKRRSVMGISPKRQEKMRAVFSKPSGGVLVFLMRLFPLTRILVSLPAGIARMPFWRFFWVSVAGTVTFYLGFMWIAYEFRDPDSRVAATTEGLKAAYASPAMDYIKANMIVTGLILLLAGIVLSIRASRRMSQDHEETGGSIVGALATAALFWGGIALAVLLYLDARLVYSVAAAGGWDVANTRVGVPFEPFSILALIAGVSILLALLLRGIRKQARRENKRLRKENDKLEFQGRKPVAEREAADTPRAGR